MSENFLGVVLEGMFAIPVIVGTLYFMSLGMQYFFQFAMKQSSDFVLPSSLRAINAIAIICLFIASMAGGISMMRYIQFNVIEGMTKKAEFTEEQQEYLTVLIQGKEVWNKEMATPMGARANFQGMIFSGRDFSDYDFSNVSFKNANLEKAKFDEACLAFIKFENANLKNASFKDAYIMGSGYSFKNADLSNADFSGAYMSAKELGWVKLDNTKKTNLRKVTENTKWR